MSTVRDGMPGGAPQAADAPVAAAARRFEAFGRVMAALATEAELVESCRDLTWWRGADHSWHLEWREGPYASEVAALLAGLVRDPAAGALATPVAPVSTVSAVLDVMGVRFVLRAVDPLGRTRVLESPGLWRLTEALDTSRATDTRHPWEELLGG